VARPLGTPATPGWFLAGRRLVAIDGTCLELPDTPANDEHFGRPGRVKGERAAFPQARVVALGACGTHAMFDAALGPYTTSENAAKRVLLAGSRRSCACLWTGALTASRHGTGLVAAVPTFSGDLLWRVKDNLVLTPTRELADGSLLAEVFDSVKDRRRTHPVVIRVVEYTIEDGADPSGPFRLITTILDPGEASAAALVAAYAERWEIESSVDELRAHQRGPRAVFRSRTPELVKRRSGAICAATTRSGPSCSTPPAPPAETPTESPLSPRSGSRIGPSPSWALFPSGP